MKTVAYNSIRGITEFIFDDKDFETFKRIGIVHMFSDRRTFPKSFLRMYHKGGKPPIFKPHQDGTTRGSEYSRIEIDGVGTCHHKYEESLCPDFPPRIQCIKCGFSVGTY